MRISQRAKRLGVTAVLLTVLAPAALAENSARCAGAGAPTAGPLLDFWLQFHESELCQEIDAVFVFYENGVEAWCVADESRAMDKLRERAEALRGSCRVDLYFTRLPRDQNHRDGSQLPPSLWNNEQLRMHLQDTGAWTPDGLAVSEEQHALRDPAFALKSRIQLFADQTLEAGRRIRQYAVDLGELSRVALDPVTRPEAAARARSIFLSHAAGLNRSLGRLDDNLKRALPVSSKGVQQSGEEKSPRAPSGPSESVEEIVRAGESIHRRVYRFIYPDEHTVGLTDLREPNLLESVAELRRLVLPILKRR